MSKTLNTVLLLGTCALIALGVAGCARKGKANSAKPKAQTEQVAKPIKIEQTIREEAAKAGFPPLHILRTGQTWDTSVAGQHYDFKFLRAGQFGKDENATYAAQAEFNGDTVYFLEDNKYGFAEGRSQTIISSDVPHFQIGYVVSMIFPPEMNELDLFAFYTEKDFRDSIKQGAADAMKEVLGDNCAPAQLMYARLPYQKDVVNPR